MAPISSSKDPYKAIEEDLIKNGRNKKRMEKEG
jgi:hypothetical protein